MAHCEDLLVTFSKAIELMRPLHLLQVLLMKTNKSRRMLKLLPARPKLEPLAKIQSFKFTVRKLHLSDCPIFKIFNKGRSHAKQSKNSRRL